MGSGDVSVDGSYHLKILIDKLAMFEHLVQADKLNLAALVADDINAILTNFDPKVYFPQIFAKFSMLFALNIDELTIKKEQKKSIQWLALKELYKVDLNSFANFDGEINYSIPAQDDFPDDSGDDNYQDDDSGQDDNYQDDEYQDDDY